ncbi:MAG: flagellar motor protein MotD [Pseudomonadota bacterium]|jgi:chemotaxis protein MotB
MARHRRRRSEEDTDRPDRWLVSYADLITLLFAFFVVMYAISQVSESKYRVLSDALVQAFQSQARPVDPDAQADPSRAVVGSERGAIVGAAPSPAEERALREALARMKVLAGELKSLLDPLVNQGLVRVSETRQGLVIEINANALFRSGQASIEPTASETLAQVARKLASTRSAIRVEGHTDDVPIATAAFASNWELSAARAAAVVRLFVESGIPASRLTAIGHADNQPVEPGSSPEARARNRRVTVTVSAQAEAGHTGAVRPAPVR